MISALDLYHALSNLLGVVDTRAFATPAQQAAIWRARAALREPEPAPPPLASDIERVAAIAVSPDDAAALGRLVAWARATSELEQLRAVQLELLGVAARTPEQEARLADVERRLGELRPPADRETAAIARRLAESLDENDRARRWSRWRRRYAARRRR